jgi:hypothetical protein
MSDSAQNPILQVNGHRVPAIAYKRIVEQWRSGWTESEITEVAMNAMRNTNIGAISEVILGAINDQKFAFAFSDETTRGKYLDIPIDSPEAIQRAEAALEETRAALSQAESIEDEHALEAMKLMEDRPEFIGNARTPSERVERQTYIDRMTKEALQRRQKAEEELSHLKEVEEIWKRLLSLSLC